MLIMTDLTCIAALIVSSIKSSQINVYFSIIIGLCIILVQNKTGTFLTNLLAFY